MYWNKSQGQFASSLIRQGGPNKPPRAVTGQARVRVEEVVVGVGGGVKKKKRDRERNEMGVRVGKN